MNKVFVTESAIHYIVGFLARYEDKYPNKSHIESLKDFRDLSNYLLERLEEPVTLNVIRHNLKRK